MGRGELAAVLWVARTCVVEAVVSSDSRSVVDGCRRWRGRRGPWKGQCDRDLWKELLWRGIPDVRWVPAHKGWLEFSARGGRREEWEGNREADRLASAEAQRRRPGLALVDRQRKRIESLVTVARLIVRIHK